MAPTGSCDVADCPNTALLQKPCNACVGSFCAAHENRDFHPCHWLTNEEWRSSVDYHSFAQVISAMATSAPRIKAAALSLRRWRACTLKFPDIHAPGLLFSDLPLPTLPSHDADWFMGGLNVHTLVTFDDGVLWLARQRKKQGNPRKRQSLESEFLTMKFLNAVAPKYVPRVWFPGSSHGTDFFFMEHMPGDNSRHILPRTGPRPDAAPLVEDMAVFLMLLSRYHVSGGIGCWKYGPGGLRRSDDDTMVEIGPLEHWSWVISNGVSTLGPFRTGREAWVAKIDAVLTALASGLLAYPTADPVVMFLFHLELRALVLQCEEMNVPCGGINGEQPTFMKHADDKNHMLVTPDGRLSAVIDWEGAYAGPFAEAFAAPRGFVDFVLFRQGRNELTEEEELLADHFTCRGRGDLAAAVRGGRKYHRLEDGLCAPGSLREVNAARRAFLGEQTDGFASMAEWEASALERFADEPGLAEVLELREAYAENNRVAAAGAIGAPYAYYRTLQVGRGARWCRVVCDGVSSFVQ